MTSRGSVNGALDRTVRVQRWTAALLTALLHGLLVLLVISPPTPITITTPQGGAGGSAMEVTINDESLSPPPAEPKPAPTHRKPVAHKKPKPSRAIARIPSTPIAQATIPMPPVAADTSDTPSVPPTNESEPPEAPRDTAAHRAQPTDVRADENARASAALAAKLGSNRGRSNNAPPAGPDMGVDGFHVYYDLVNENRLREWRDQGMTELFLPLPGTLRLMVCPLEVALRRGSGKCHMVDMDSPELKFIGDAREVIDIQRVYQLGDVVWSGPGPYR